MTDLKFKGYVDIKDSLHRKSYYSFLKMGKDIIEYHLESSLELDGRFYGAEWMLDYEPEDLLTDRLLYSKPYFT